MMMKHNKKRNVGIIYEQLAQAFSESLVEKNQKKAILVKKIIDQHFQRDGEIFKEFKIFNALVKVYANSDSLATNILKEAKEATRSLNRKKLDIEKSLLIKDINYTLNEDNFYSWNISEYRNLATVQSLMNLWSQNSKNDLEKLVVYEGKVHGILREEKANNSLTEQVDENIDSLVVRVMQEKFDKKYKSILSENQTRIIQNYVCGNHDEIREILKEVKQQVVEKTRKYNNVCENKILLEKSERVMNNLNSLDENLVDDDNVAKFLLACKLCEQLEES